MPLSVTAKTSRTIPRANFETPTFNSMVPRSVNFTALSIRFSSALRSRTASTLTRSGRPAAIDDPVVVVGGFDPSAVETYEARCIRHHEIAPPRGAIGDVVIR